MSRVPLTRAAVLAVAALVSLAGCAHREVREKVYDRQRCEIFLRSYERFGKPIERHFEQPAVVSPERLANILGAIDIRGREESLPGLRAAFAPENLPALGEGLSTALAAANPNQEIAVRMITKVIQHGIFDRRYLTTFVAYVENDLLYLHFSRIDWKIPQRETKTDLPWPEAGEHPMKFKVVPAESMYPEGLYAVSVEWKDPIFARPLRVAEAGDRRQRTILMEEPESARPKDLRPPLPSDVLARLTPAQLRELADLEEARQQGRITEGQYRRQRKEILDRAGAGAPDSGPSPATSD